MTNEKTLINLLKPLNPEKIILFGSFIKGNTSPDSDIDVLIVQKTDKKPSDRIADVLKLVWGNTPHIEAQVLTPGEFKNAIAENRYFITQEVLKYGKLIYDSKN